MDFLLTMQYAVGRLPAGVSGAPAHSYSNYVTFNDNAMARVLLLLDRPRQAGTPLAGDLFTDEQRARAGDRALHAASTSS